MFDETLYTPRPLVADVCLASILRYDGCSAGASCPIAPYAGLDGG